MNRGFNPRARWDRRMPADSGNSGLLNEKIEVLAWFKAGRIHPRLFVWKNKIYKIKSTTYNWQERDGRDLISYFSVSTGSDLYQISFNSATSGWRIDKIIVV